MAWGVTRREEVGCPYVTECGVPLALDRLQWASSHVGPGGDERPLRYGKNSDTPSYPSLSLFDDLTTMPDNLEDKVDVRIVKAHNADAV